MSRSLNVLPLTVVPAGNDRVEGPHGNDPVCGGPRRDRISCR